MKKTIIAMALCALAALAGCEKKPGPMPGRVEVTSVELDHSAVVLSPGETVQLTATVFPEDAYYKSLTWSSTREGVATVDKNGLVTAVSAGKTTINVAAGEVVAGCRVTVKEALPEVVDMAGGSCE